MFINKVRLVLIRALTLVVLFTFASVEIVTAQGLPLDQLQSLQSGALYFNTEDETGSGNCSSSASSSSSGAPSAVNNAFPPNWNSNVQPPYYLESFVINVLDDIAQIENVPTSDTVTQDHVVALVAWGYAEGGNIANTDIFNIWNTGLDDPSLLAGGASGDGVQSFASFDDGVSAAADTMTEPQFSRLAQTLVQPDSTAGQFMQALTYFQNFNGNVAWAEADQNGNYQGTNYTQAAYLQALTDELTQTSTNYAEMASVEIGPGQENTNHYSGALQYSGGVSDATSSATSGSGCTGSSVSCNGQAATGNAAIACDAQKYNTLSYSESWHSSGSVFHTNCNDTYPTKPPPAVGPNCYTDCSGLVNIVIYDVFNNDIDDNTYGEVSDTKNFAEISAGQLMPGDFIQPEAEKGDHVMIVLSVGSGGSVQVFEARTENAPQPQQVEQTTYTLTPGDVYLRYVGTGSTYPIGGQDENE
jgi:hypothetical protein